MRNHVIKIWPLWNKECQIGQATTEKWHIIIIITIIVISFFKADFHITFYNYEKKINVNLQEKFEKNVGTKRCAINQLTILFLN